MVQASYAPPDEHADEAPATIARPTQTTTPPLRSQPCPTRGRTSSGHFEVMHRVACERPPRRSRNGSDRHHPQPPHEVTMSQVTTSVLSVPGRVRACPR